MAEPLFAATACAVFLMLLAGGLISGAKRACNARNS